MNSWTTDDFAFDLRRSVAPPAHLWVMSGRCTVAPLDRTVLGVAGVCAPPIMARDLTVRFTLSVDGRRQIPDNGPNGKGDRGLPYAGGRWRPDRIVRQGTYHQIPADDRSPVSLAVESHLVPLSRHPGFLVVARIANRSARDLHVALVPQLDAGHPTSVSLNELGFGWPRQGAQANNIDAHASENDEVRAEIETDQPLSATIAAGATHVFRLGVFVRPRGTARDESRPSLARLDELAAQDWQSRVDQASQRLPQLRSDIDGLEEYYRRSLVSGLVCLWDHPSFVTRPFLATAGIEGAGLVCYLWDTGGYMPLTLAMLLGPRGLRSIIEQFLRIDIAEHYAFAPAGRGIGVGYSYSAYSLVNLVWHLIAQHGDDGGADGALDLIEPVVETFLRQEAALRTAERDHLADYGTWENLLEGGTSGYEHFVPSPNAERAWAMDRLADLMQHAGIARIGEADSAALRAKAASVRDAIRRQLWNPRAGWFDCVYPSGHREQVYSIQMFNVLGTGVCDDEMTARLVAALDEKGFLGEFGVSSIGSADRVHYETGDPDWSGAGCYTGSAPLLAKLLWEAGHGARAWDVLRRLLWMGRHLPYFPQEHYCDRPQAPHQKRANIVSGLAGVEAIIAGLMGIRPRLDGQLSIAPQPLAEGQAELSGYRYRGSEYAVRMEHGRAEVRRDGNIL